MLEIALRSENSQASIKAYNLICGQHKKIISAILESDAFRETAKKVMSGEISLITLNRFAIIVNTCFKTNLDLAIEKCNFLEAFFPYATLISCSPFSQILDNGLIEHKIIPFFKENNLLQKLMKCIDELPDELTSNTEVELAVSYYEILHLFATKDEFCNILIQKDYLEIVTKHFKTFIQNILFSQWGTLVLLCNFERAQSLKQYIPLAVETLANTKDLYRYHVWCVNFLEKMLTFGNSSDITSSFSNLKVCRVVTDLIKKYPNCSYIHLKIVKLLKAMIVRPFLTKYVISEMVPFLSEHIAQNNDIILYAICCNIITEFRDTPQRELLMTSLPKFVIDCYNEHQAILVKDYGGVAPLQSPSRFSPDKFLLLFKRTLQ